MAFDRPIEADRIDDFNLFSAFVRAPLWILGGVLGGNKSMNEEDNVTVRRLDDTDDENSPPELTKNSRCHKRIVSDYDLASMDTDTPDHVFTGNVSCNEMSDCQNFTTETLRRTKNLSWSDESGKSLVEYDDESVLHEPSPYSSVTSTSAPKPVKSAMRRSQSIRSEADGMASSQDSTRYIPKMTVAKSSLIIPTRPFGADASGTGMESPQLGYGFYTNLTPPTPEMYHSHAIKHPRSVLGQNIPTHTASSALSVGRTHNQVFQNLQHNNAPMGWTSVPI